MATIDVCIATYKRPVLLEKLLHSLADQETRGALDFRIIVVDNDAEGTAESVVRQFRHSSLAITYDVEPERNISQARNRSLSHATAEFVATIDDDAIAERDWLRQLLGAAKYYHADVVFGAVQRLLPDGSPDYLLESGVFELPNPPTGATENLVYNTANSLFRRCLVCDLENPFDRALGMTGGEDTQLFHSLREQGAHVIWCREARVREFVLPERANLRWVLRRAFREGMTSYRVRQRWEIAPNASSPERFIRLGVWTARMSCQILARLVAAPVQHGQLAKLIRDLRNVAYNLGVAAQTLGLVGRERCCG